MQFPKYVGLLGPPRVIMPSRAGLLALGAPVRVPGASRELMGIRDGPPPEGQTQVSGPPRGLLGPFAGLLGPTLASGTPIGLWGLGPHVGSWTRPQSGLL